MYHQHLNTHSDLIQYHLTPQAPEGTELRARRVPARKTWARQHSLSATCMAGAFFKSATPANRMQSGDIAKVATLSIDVDFCDHPGLLEEWQGTSKERKERLYEMGQEEVLDLMDRLNFLQDAIAAAHEAGLPEKPNRVLYTGHGACLLYWAADDEGWADSDKGNGWTPARMKAAVKRWFDGEAHAYWWWDRDAKDVGTRVFPLPGEPHRERGHAEHYAWGKTIATFEYGTDEVVPLTPWFEAIEAKYPTAVKKKRKPGPKPTAAKTKTATSRNADTPDWTTQAWKPEWDAEYGREVGERGACPLCDTSNGCRRMEENRYACFSCGTQMPKATTFNFTFDLASFQKDPNHIELDALGRAKWPDLVPGRVLLKTRTGSGKTWLMEREKKRWLSRNQENQWRGDINSEYRVIAVSPYNSLASDLANRLNCPHATPESSWNWRNGSASCTFASLERVCKGMHPAVLSRTMFVIDEVEQMLGQVQSMLTGQKGREAYEVLSYLLAHAGRVILADAHASEGTALLLENANLKRGWRDLPPVTYTEWTSAPHAFTFKHILPVERLTKTGKVVTQESASARHKQLLHNEVEAGKRVAVYVPSKRQAEALGSALSDCFPGKSVRVITGGKGYKETHDFSESSLKHDVLVYNAAMGTGVSFDVPDWYDSVHCVLDKANNTTGPQVEQAIHRIRKPKCAEYTISGSWTEVVTDWRTDPTLVLDRAYKAWQKGEQAAKDWAGVDLKSDYHADPASKRLTVAQAVNMAEAYKNGMRAVLSWLETRHSFTPAQGSSGDFASEVSSARDSAKRAEATAIAQAAPLNEAEMAKVESVGHADEAERIRVRATVITETFGDAFSNASASDKYDIVFDAEHRKLSQKARVWAAVRLLDIGEAGIVSLAEKRFNSKKTVMQAKTWQRDAAVVLELLRSLSSLPYVDGRMAVSVAAARAACVAIAPRMKHAGRKFNDDWNTQPIKQLQMILAWVGVKLGCTRTKVSGVTVRNYWLAESQLTRMNALSMAFLKRWVDKADEEKSKQAVENG